MRRALPIVILLLLILVLALGFIPARFAAVLTASTPLQLSGYADTIWDGRAARARLQTAAGLFQLGAVDWRLRALPLLTGALAADVKTEWGAQRIEARLHKRGNIVHLQELDASFDAALIKQALPVAIEGRIELLFPTLSIDEDRVTEAEGSAVWRNAAWTSSSGRQNLGDFVLRANTPQPGVIDLRVESLSGNLNIEGEGQLLEDRYTLELLISSPGLSMNSDLQQALALIATPTENGYLLRLDGELVAKP